MQDLLSHLLLNWLQFKHLNGDFSLFLIIIWSVRIINQYLKLLGESVDLLVLGHNLSLRCSLLLFLVWCSCRENVLAFILNLLGNEGPEILKVEGEIILESLFVEHHSFLLDFPISEGNMLRRDNVTILGNKIHVGLSLGHNCLGLVSCLLQRVRSIVAYIAQVFACLFRLLEATGKFVECLYH